MGDSFDAIRAAGSVDPAWITAVLHHAGIGRANTVVAVADGAIGTGQMGDNIRFALTWRDDDASLPATVVGKFPSTSETSRATAVSLDSYRQEVGFYRDLRPSVTINTPVVHHAGWDEATHDFVLVMDDLAPARQGDQLVGCSIEQAEAVIDEAVGLHAPTWGSALELAGRIDWLTPPSDERLAMLEWIIGHTWPGFAERYADRIDEDDIVLGKAVADGYRAIHDAVVAWAERYAAWAVVHGDYRLDNLLFDTGDAPEREPGSSHTVTVVDWQTIGVGIGPMDVAYFCGAGLVPSARREHERALVARYASALRGAGVVIDDDAVWDGYVLGTASGLLTAVIASQLVERTDRGDEMFVAMVTRHADQIRTVGLLDRIGA
jgi:hypothetical protein